MTYKLSRLQTELSRLSSFAYTTQEVTQTTPLVNTFTGWKYAHTTDIGNPGLFVVASASELNGLLEAVAFMRKTCFLWWFMLVWEWGAATL